ncbi:MAG TPA: hypothetical protein VIG89_00670 [Candidatus Acidoferrales bacterium]
MLEQLHRRYGTTIVMITHDPRAAAHATVVQLEKGKLRAAESVPAAAPRPAVPVPR